MRAVLLRSLAVIAVGGIVLAGVLYVASTVDARSPTVLEIRLTAPVAGDDRVALITTSVEITFSEPIATAGADDAVRLEPAVPGAVSWSGSAMIFTPNDPLELETTYRLVVEDGIRDAAGNEMAQLPPPFEFRTAGRPVLASSEPADGSDEVAVDAPISLTFSTLMDTASVEEALRIEPDFEHELRWSGELLEIVPAEPLDPGEEYELSIGDSATDAAGVALDAPVRLAFTTVAPGLAVRTVMPADGVDGIAPISPIAVIFDRPIDPGSVSDDALAITPGLAGTLEVVALPDDPPTDDGAGSLLRFTPSGPMPPNTTFEVELAGPPTSVAGGTLAEPLRWSFTTGAPPSAITNGITFVTQRAGVANVWVMNPDGSGQRQVTAELTPVLDYAVAPDGSSLVVADGRRLVYQRSNGGDRRVLTDEGVLEFDPAYAPDGLRVAFGRADAETGEGLGLWEWEVGGGDPVAIPLPADLDEPRPSGDIDAPAGALRAPRYAPDGQAVAFVDASGAVGIVELPAQRLTRAEFGAAAPPLWLPDSGGVLITGSPATDIEPATLEAPVLPLAPGPDDAVHLFGRSGTDVGELRLGQGSVALAVGPDGRIAFVDREGRLRTVGRVTATPAGAPLTEEPVASAAFAPGERAMVLAMAAGEGVGPIERLDLETRRRQTLAPDGAWPRWLP